MKIAVVGSGISGLVAARLLCTDNEVHVFEAGNHVGGHSNTVACKAFGREYAVDTGFMVFNDRTYPNFVRLLELLGVPSRPSDMSFSVRCDKTSLEYQGSSLNGLFAQRSNLLSPAFHGMLIDILRFNRRAVELLKDGDQSTVGEFLRRHRFGQRFIDHYFVPMGAAIWSAPPGEFEKFPARFIVEFFANHGLLSVRGHPQWKTISGGAAQYVEALARPFADRIRLNCPVVAVTRGRDQVTVESRHCSETFEAIVLASHADQSLAILNDASPAEQSILGAFSFQKNDLLLHTDSSQLPRSRRAWASWNYRIPQSPGLPVVLTYNLNRLQGHESPEPICITLNSAEGIAAEKVLKRLSYEHPLYNSDALRAQSRLHEINGRNRTYYCGAYWGRGFHEDGVNSALAVGRLFNKRLESCTVASTKAVSSIGE